MRSLGGHATTSDDLTLNNLHFTKGYRKQGIRPVYTAKSKVCLYII